MKLLRDGEDIDFDRPDEDSRAPLSLPVEDGVQSVVRLLELTSRVGGCWPRSSGGGWMETLILCCL